jgi:hypothetical protein
MRNRGTPICEFFQKTESDLTRSSSQQVTREQADGVTSYRLQG